MMEISYRELSVNPMTLFGEEWFALASGNEKDGAKSSRSGGNVYAYF